MKIKILIPMYLMLNFCILGQGPTYSNCVKQITSNPNNNNSNNEFSNLFPGKINPFINQFNWGSYTGSTFNSIQLNPNSGFSLSNYSMHSPYSSTMPSEYYYLRNGSSNGPNGVDWHWEDGWELMWLNLGYYPNGEGISTVNSNRIIIGSSSPSNSKTPYFILYNRYSRTLRIFANILGELGSANNVQTKIYYPDNSKMSGILRHLGNNDQSLDYYSKENMFTSYNKNPGNDNAWFSTDIKLGYDPCVCEFESMLAIVFESVTLSDVKLYGRSISMNLPLLDQNKNLTFPDFLNSYDIANKKNNVLYKVIDDVVLDYKTQLTKYTNDLADYKDNEIKRKLLGMALNAIKGAATSGISSIISDEKLTNFALKTMGKLRNNASPFNTAWDYNTSKKLHGFLVAQGKSLLGSGMDQLNMTLIGNNEEPKKPTMPTATFSEMYIDGTISTTKAFTIGSFFTPGAFNAGTTFSAFDYPIWNNPTGLFALLEQPKIKYHSISHTALEPTIYNGQQITVPAELYIQLEQPLKYRYNHAVGIDFNKTKSYAMFEIMLENKNFSRYIPIPQGTFKKGDDVPDEIGNLILNHGLGDSLIYISPWEDIDNMHNIITGFNEYIKMHYIGFSSDITIKSIKLKIMNDVYFTNPGYGGKEINTVDVFSYVIYNSMNTATAGNINYLSSNSTFLKYIPGYLTLENETISPNTRGVTSVVGNKIYIDAENLIFKGNISVTSGYTVDARFLNGSEIKSNCIMNGDIDIYSKKDYYNLPLSLEVDDNYLNSFCVGNSKKYKANSSSSVLLNDSSNSNHNKKIKEKSVQNLINTSVYPNPASQNVFVAISNQNVEDYEFQIVDTDGRVLINEKLSGEINPTFEIDIKMLVDGMYTLHIYANGQHLKTHKIIKIKS